MHLTTASPKLPFEQILASPARSAPAPKGCTPARTHARLLRLALLCIVAFATTHTFGQAPAQTGPSRSPSAAPQSANALPPADPKSLAQQCAAREAELIQHPHSFLRYRIHAIDDKGDQVRDTIETPQGTVARLILRDGKPLTPEQDTAERERLQYQLDSPSSFARHIRNEQSNKKMGLDILKLMPDAMLWSYAPSETPPLPHSDSSSGHPPLVLDFKPNPQWTPPTLASEALTGLAGRIWIDPETHNMVQIEASLIKPVNVGWGMVAHLYPGGTVSLHQTRAANDRWIADHVLEQLNVRALMLKTIRQKLSYDTSAYQAVPPMTTEQAIRLLLDTPLPQQ